jgi:hypothetical protein
MADIFNYLGPGPVALIMKPRGQWFKSPLPLVLDFIIHFVFSCLQPRFIQNTRLYQQIKALGSKALM